MSSLSLKISKTSRLFRFIYCIFLLHQIIFADQEFLQKMEYVNFDSSQQISDNKYCSDGFLQGTLVQTVDGYIPIELIQVGDCVIGMQGVQEVLSVKKGRLDRYIRLLMSNGVYIHAAMHQDFYLEDRTLFPAAALCQGYRLLNGLYVVDNEFIHEPCNSYCLTTEHHAFFIYPGVLVHNFNHAVIGALGSYSIGNVNVLGVVPAVLVVITCLTNYAVQYFRLHIIYNCEFSEEDTKLTIEKLCLQNAEVVQQTRNYFDTKRRLLNSLHQDLIKIKNEVFAFVRPNNLHTFDFSFGLLSQYKPILYTLSTLPNMMAEVGSTIANKEKLIQLRQTELDKLQEDIFDTHLTLVLHITELIDRRNLAKQQLLDVIDPVNKDVNSWNKNLCNISVSVALAHYKTQFLWKEMLDNLELKTNELKYVMSYYEKLKNHFFMTKTTNFIDIFQEQAKINKANLELIEKGNAIWWSNMCSIEKFLTRHNCLTEQLVKQYQCAAQEYRAERDKNPIVFAQKRKDDIKKQFSKESEDKKKGGGGGGPEQDPDDPKIIGYFIAAITHIFQIKDGHLLNTPENRKLLLEMALNFKNYARRTIVEKTGTIKHWYGRILPDGTQLWDWAKDGLIRDGGINKIPRSFDPQTGFCRNPFKN